MAESAGKQLERLAKANTDAVRARLKAQNASAEADLAERSLQVAQASLKLDTAQQAQEARAEPGAKPRPTSIFAEGRVDPTNPLRAVGADQGGLSGILSEMSPAEAASGGRAVQTAGRAGRGVPPTTTTTETTVRPREVGTRGRTGGGVTLPFETTRTLTRPNVLTPFQAARLGQEEERIAISREGQRFLQEHRKAIEANDRIRADATMKQAVVAEKRYQLLREQAEGAYRAMPLDILAGATPAGAAGAGKPLLTPDQFGSRIQALFDADGKLKGGAETQRAAIVNIQRAALRNAQLFLVNPPEGIRASLFGGATGTALVSQHDIINSLLIADGTRKASTEDQNTARKFLNDLGVFEFDPKTGAVTGVKDTVNKQGAQWTLTLFNQVKGLEQTVGGPVNIVPERESVIVPKKAEPVSANLAEPLTARELGHQAGANLPGVIPGATRAVARAGAEATAQSAAQAVEAASEVGNIGLGVVEGSLGLEPGELGEAAGGVTREMIQAAENLGALLDAKLAELDKTRQQFGAAEAERQAAELQERARIAEENRRALVGTLFPFSGLGPEGAFPELSRGR